MNTPTSNYNNGPIGVFDSGVGGLTVLSALQKTLPHEQFIYIGDTARAPYGCKPVQLVRQFAEELTLILKDKGCKLVVIACNSASAAADLEALEQKAGIPVIGVIHATVGAALKNEGRIGVIATSATIRSAAYQSAIQMAHRECWAVDAPLFAPLVEEGLWNDPLAQMIARHYLAAMPQDISTLILGCTHYPFLRHVIQKIWPRVHLLSSGEATAEAVQQTLRDTHQEARPSQLQETCFFTSGDKDTFLSLAQRLGMPIKQIQRL